MKYLLSALFLAVFFLANSGCGKRAVHESGGVDQKTDRGGAAAQDDKAPVPRQKEQVEAGHWPRRIIYTATIRLMVEDFARAQATLLKQVEEHRGYVAASEVTGNPGSPRAGHWKVRIPAERFAAFRDAIAGVGELERLQIDSQDVTDEYFDLETRIKNKQVEETRLLKHLEKSTGTLQDILTVEKELSRVRGEIEQHQGRLLMLKNLTALTTVTVFIRERGVYQPPESPAFGTLIARTFGESCRLLLEFGRTMVLLAVVLAPWMVPLGIIAFGVMAWRRRTRRPVSAEAMKPNPEKDPGTGPKSEG
jgi:hypothetical protein